MIHFQDISLTTFLRDYWQKKPLVIRQAIPNFINPISPDELAGLALEEDAESRIVIQTPKQKPYWQLQRGPFVDSDFSKLPESHWTLLVQGVDRMVPEVYELLNHFDFLPQWRIDDVMISFASQKGSVGPHYDNYDVFLYQAKGRREWSLTTENCNPQNHIADLELRIMDSFHVEEKFILEEGDMLYLPPHVGHHGISLSDECMTYSFGYRSYQGQELLDSLGDFSSEKEVFTHLYHDPDWSEIKNTSELPASATQKARELLLELINDDALMQSWFGCFATRLDESAEQQLPLALEEDELLELPEFIDELLEGYNLVRDACCRFAYQQTNTHFKLYINGCEWNIEDVSPALIHLIANNRIVENHLLHSFLENESNQLFLYELWTLQWLQMLDPNQ